MKKSLRYRDILSLLVMALLPLLSVGVASASDGGTHPVELAIRRIYGFKASDFDFKVIVPDDGKDEAGGWQLAAITPLFRDARSGVELQWYCSVTVQVPMRTKADGIISKGRAAQLSASAANTASDAVMGSRPAWIPALFCPAFAVAMQKLLQVSGASGARVSGRYI